jgi:hypothetical protein
MVQLHWRAGGQIVWRVTSRSPVVRWLSEVYYWVVWVRAGTSTVLRAVAADF